MGESRGETKTAYFAELANFRPKNIPHVVLKLKKVLCDIVCGKKGFIIKIVKRAEIMYRGIGAANTGQLVRHLCCNFSAYL